jgi:hypothetical protein
MIAKELALAYRPVKKLKGYMARSTVERPANWILTKRTERMARESFLSIGARWRRTSAPAA